MKKVIPIAFVIIAAALVLALAGLLIGSLVTQFSPKPTEFENTMWESEDGHFRLYVYEYDPETLQCRAELVYNDGEQKFTYVVSDAPYGVLGVYTSVDDIDEWLRVKCTSRKFTARINRTASLEYASAYGKNEKLTFKLKYFMEVGLKLSND